MNQSVYWIQSGAMSFPLEITTDLPIRFWPASEVTQPGESSFFSVECSISKEAQQLLPEAF